MAGQPHPIDVEVGKIIRDQRRLRKISQLQLGEIVGVSLQQVQKYERGANRVSASMLVMIAQALDIRVGTFFAHIDDGDAGTGDEENQSELFNASRQGIQLHRAFFSIKDELVRRKVLSLVKAISNTEDPYSFDDDETEH